MLATARLLGLCRLAPMVALSALLFGCGGGGGGGGGGGSSATDLHLSASSVDFSTLQGEAAGETKNVQIIWSSPRVAGVAVGTLPGQSLPAWLQVSATGNASPVSLHLTRAPNGNVPGKYSTTLRVVSGDSSANILESVDLAVSMDVAPMPSVSPTPVNLSWVESEQPASRQLSATHDARVLLVGSSVDVPWLNLSASGDTLTLAGNAQSQSQVPGALAGNVTATFSFGGRQTNVTVPIAATVTKALSGPAQIAPEVNASTTSPALAFGATVATATAAAVPFTASTGVPWLTAASGTTGSPNNLALTLQSTELNSMANGTYTATITITSSAPNVSSLQIPVSFKLRLPEVHFVAPVAFTDTVASDTVIVRGQGFDDPNAVLKLAGNAVSSPTLVNDTEIRFVPGARLANDYQVEVTNQLGFSRDKANLRVTDPPAYANFSMGTTVGFQARVISSPINGVVFTQKCFFCSGGTIPGTLSTVQRFAFDSGTGNWTSTQHTYTNLYDIALTPDESSLIVLTDTQLLLVDPLTMATSKTVSLPATFSGISRQLAVMNNGLVIIQALIGKAYSLRTGLFVDVNGLSVASGGIQASRDGSRAIFGAPVNDGTVAYRYYDASTGNVVISATSEHYQSGAYSRHAERAFVNGFFLDANLAKLGTFATGITSISGDISPAGNRIYSVDFSGSSPYPLRIFDVTSNTSTELTPISTGSTKIGQVAADPHGGFVFFVGEDKFVVFAVP
jgi:hypothetical protein